MLLPFVHRSLLTPKTPSGSDEPAELSMLRPAEVRVLGRVLTLCLLRSPYYACRPTRCVSLSRTAIVGQNATTRDKNAPPNALTNSTPKESAFRTGRMSKNNKTQYLSNIISYGSHQAIKHWLRISGIHPHTANNEANFYALLYKLVGEDKLRINQLRAVALELEEYGGKRIYLGKLSDYKTIGLRQRFVNHLQELGLELDDERKEPRRLTARPHLNYICWSPQEVRIGYSEKHEFIKPNRVTRSWDTVSRTNVIVISAQPSNGAVKIMMDTPGQTHPHQPASPRDDTEGYEEYYGHRALELLGAAEFRPINLVKVADGIKKAGTDVFEETDASERTSHNSRQRTWSRSDVRDDPAYNAAARVDGDRRVVESLSGYWLPAGSAGKLQRKVWMHLSMREQMVQFAANLLEREVEYAISRIRAI